MSRIFSQEMIEITIFRYTYLDNGEKCVEILRPKVKLKPFLDKSLSVINLGGYGNKYRSGSNTTCAQTLSIIPTDESELFGENYDGQFFRHKDSSYDVALNVMVMKDDLRITKKLFHFKLDVPSVSGMSVPARFKGRLKRGEYATVVKGQGMWKTFVGGERGNLFVRLTVR